MGTADHEPEGIVREEDLDALRFRCCGDEDLFPFRCSGCGRIMVFCYECETLYEDLHDLERHDRHLNHSDPSRPIFSCPACGHDFEFHFMTNRAYDVPKADWLQAGHEELLCR